MAREREGATTALIVVSLVIGAALVLASQALAQAEIDPDAKPALDPFVVLVEKPKPTRRPRPVQRRRPTRPTRPRIPPLVVKIQTIIGAGNEYLAVIEYQGGEYIVGEGWPEGVDEPTLKDRRFKVVEVTSDKMIVYDQKAKSRKTIRLNEEGITDGITLGG